MCKSNIMQEKDLIRIAHLRSKGWKARKVLWKAGIEFDIDLIKDWHDDGHDVDNDKTEINDKDSYNKLFDQSFDQKGSRDI